MIAKFVCALLRGLNVGTVDVIGEKKKPLMERRKAMLQIVKLISDTGLLCPRRKRLHSHGIVLNL